MLNHKIQFKCKYDVHKLTNQRILMYLDLNQGDHSDRGVNYSCSLQEGSKASYLVNWEAGLMQT